MAVAKMVCGECGAQLNPGDAFCPKCGARIEGVTARSEALVCGVCGHANPPGADNCEACGARLAAGAVAKKPQAPARGDRPGKKAEKRDAGGRHVEPWQIVSGIAVLVLIAFLIYTQLSDDGSRTRPAGTSGSMPGGTAQMPAATALKDLEPLRRAVASRPNDPAALLDLGNALFDNGVFPEAVDTYKKYLALKPGDSDARVDMGICYYQMGIADSASAPRLFAEAVKEMETAYKGNPTHQPSAFNLGIVNLYRGDVEASNKWLRRAVEINKGSELGVRAQKILDQHTFQQ